MKHFGIFYILLFFLPAVAQEQTARVSIYSNPTNVQIRLDSLPIGTTPLNEIRLNPGQYRIEALSPYEGLWNYSNIVREITVSGNTDTTIRIRFHEEVKINSIPYHAKLMRNNKILGRTPLEITFEENKGKEFRLEKKGYKSFRFILQKQQSQIYKLDPLVLEGEELEEASFTHNLFYKNRTSKFLLLTGTVLTHWLAFYFKNIADDKFEKYESTGNPAQMQKYWDDTQRFDRYSDITLGVSYAMLSGLIYTVLWK